MRPSDASWRRPIIRYILPREALAGSYDLSKVVIGSGPFLLDTITPDVAYTYKRNPDYFDKGRPFVDNLKLAVIPTDRCPDRTIHLGQHRRADHRQSRPTSTR